MDQKTDRLYPSELLENIDLQQGLEGELDDVNSFNNSSKTMKKWLPTSKIKTTNPKRKIKNQKTLTTILKSIDTFVFIATTSSCITLSLTGNGLVPLPLSTAKACGLSIGKNVIYEIIINRYNIYKKQYEKDQQTIKSFDKLYRKFLKDNIIDKDE